MLFLLAQHLSVAAPLCAELGRDEPSADRIQGLPLLDAVVKESLRILPPVPVLVRVAGVAVELAGIALRPGDRVACSPYVTQHLPSLFPEPEQFRPQRWFAGKSEPGTYAYLPSLTPLRPSLDSSH